MTTKPKLVVNNVNKDSTLDKLIRHAKDLARQCTMTFAFESVETRRNRALEYGRALAAIRGHIARQVTKRRNEFHHVIGEHGLNVGPAGKSGFRSDAMWLAEQWDALLLKAKHCPDSNPRNIRTWCRKRGWNDATGWPPEILDPAESDKPAEPKPATRKRLTTEEVEEILKLPSLEQTMKLLENGLLNAVAAYDQLQKILPHMAPLQPSDTYLMMETDLRRIQQHLKSLTPLFMGTQSKLEETSFYDFFGIKQ